MNVKSIWNSNLCCCNLPSSCFVNASGKLVSSGTTDTELGYLNGVTSAVQAQLNGKLNLTGGTLTGLLAGTSATFTSTLGVTGLLSGTTGAFTVNDAATNSVLDILTLTHTTSGTAASGLGAGILFRTERPSGGITLNRGAIYGVSGTDADDDGDLAFYTLRDTGTGGFNEKMRLTANGTLAVGTNALVSDTLLPIQINAIATTGQAYFAANNAGGYGLLIGYDNANGYARIRNVSNTALTFETNNVERSVWLSSTERVPPSGVMVSALSRRPWLTRRSSRARNAARAK